MIQTCLGNGESVNCLHFDFLQMALWLPNTGKLYLPPSKPTPRVLHTDEYIRSTNVYFCASTDRLLTVGHPYFPIRNPVDDKKIDVPKVSGSQYRVFRFKLPDPNKFALVDQSLFNPEEERLVWRLRAVELGRGGPLGVGVSGHPYFNKFVDAENPNDYPVAQADDNRLDMAMEPKHNQIFIVGCVPPIGEHWDKAKPCNERPDPGTCPPIQLVNSPIEDGDMCDSGFGALNFDNLCEDRASFPLDIINETSKFPDFLKMNKDPYGDHIFFYGLREQLYVRHIGARGGAMGDTIPLKPGEYYYNPKQGTPEYTIASHAYFTTVSGSLNSSEAQIFNRPYFLQRAQGPNNGICWNEDLFVTVLDTTRNTNFNISVYKNQPALTPSNYTYKAADFNQFLRHVEEFEFEFVVQLCKVPLTADVLAHLNVMNSKILDNWNLAFVPPAPTGIEDAYRYIQSMATRCPTENPTPEPTDPYKDLHFWDVDMTDRFSSELSQSYLGRRFMYQIGMLNGTKRLRTDITTSNIGRSRKTAKRRKTKA